MYRGNIKAALTTGVLFNGVLFALDWLAQGKGLVTTTIVAILIFSLLTAWIALVSKRVLASVSLAILFVIQCTVLYHTGAVIPVVLFGFLSTEFILLDLIS